MVEGRVRAVGGSLSAYSARSFTDSKRRDTTLRSAAGPLRDVEQRAVEAPLRQAHVCGALGQRDALHHADLARLRALHHHDQAARLWLGGQQVRLARRDD
eukprot:CAMPEP_0196712398 /NCGR_PEP_ID=MMETSP1090-20130531/74301_1 /TAXON_ID=37098 /ORGANISM="Isochrysis sp, Strain CCMP1244" /LENGTH=99 /DNA_ID=CAMNT_0042052487 /DNA_START=52 /DNA_END=348 /DNA_ORIENTATION=+